MKLEDNDWSIHHGDCIPHMAEDMEPQCYSDFIARKRVSHIESGFDPPQKYFNPHFKDFQSDAFVWNCRKGRSCNFIATGLGKTLLELAFADACVRHTNSKALILAPLAVSHQTKREADKFGINDVRVCRENCEVKPGITITNYERLHKFDLSQFDIIVPDESSCIKHMDSKTTKDLTAEFSRTRYKLPSTATPAPNDQMELGTHAEFVGAMSRSEMLSMFFVHDGGDTAKWRLRGHAKTKFYEFLASFALAIRKPGDLGYSNDGYDLPPLNFHEHTVASPVLQGRLFAVDAVTLHDQREACRETIESRVAEMHRIVKESGVTPWIIWCNLNDESRAATDAMRSIGAVEITGSDHPDKKEENLLAFSEGKIPILITKREIAGWGLNWQHCCKQGNLGVNHSWEMWHQGIMRSHRYGQKKPVDVHTVISEAQVPVLANVKRKQSQSESMVASMVAAMGDITQCELKKLQVMDRSYNPNSQMKLQPWIKSGWPHEEVRRSSM